MTSSHWRADRCEPTYCSLADAAGIEVSEVEVVDASRRTTAANAYVTGLGATKKVVIYDTVVDDFPRAEARSILAHELAHEHYDDVPRGLLYVAIVAPLGVLAIALLAGPTPSLPALALALVVVSTVDHLDLERLSREVEARADSFALTLTDEPEAFDRAARAARPAQRLRPRPTPLHRESCSPRIRAPSSGSAWRAPTSA